ncbi:MAG TPA: hypothetical protein VF384_16520 [Planctomycetota bacterium]
MNDPTTTQKKRFTPKTTLLEVLTADHTLGSVLMRDFHIGGCRNCGFNPQDSIETVAEQNGIPTDRLLAALNRDS